MMQYGRQAEVILDNSSLNLKNYHMEFQVEFDDTTKLNHAEVKLWNLSNERITSIKKGIPLIINAGYQEDVGSVFVGVVYYMNTVKEGVDRVTTVKAVDAVDQIKKLKVSKSYKAGIKASQVITDVARSGGISIATLALVNDVTYRNGKSVNGSVPGILKAIAKDCGSKFHIAKQQAYFRGGDEGDNISFLFNTQRGLIGSPEPFEEERDEKTIKGYNVKVLLNHRVQADSIVGIESKHIKGTYRVMEGEHVMTESDFYTIMRVV